MTVEQMALLMEYYATKYARRAGDFGARITPVQYGYQEGEKPLHAFLVKPYIGQSARQAAGHRRPLVSVAAGFDRKNLQGVQVAFELMTYLAEGCEGNEIWCSYDYYIMPDARSNGRYQSKRDKYRHRAHRRSARKLHQERIKTQEAIRKNTVLSITISKLGGVITTPHAYSSEVRANYETEKKYMEKFTEHNNYRYGTYAAYHGKGYPKDYNSAVSPGTPSFNVALERGGVAGHPYVYHDDDVNPVFRNFALGFFHLVEYAAQQRQSYGDVSENY